MIHDVVVVGAGPGGSSAASLLAAAGVSTLLLDKAVFPRDKVCGDGLAPQAIYWLDRLGCVQQVLAASRACVRSCDIYVNGRYVLTGGFPDDTPYPRFAVLLERRRLDQILVEHAVRKGARFQPGTLVRGVERGGNSARVLAEVNGKRVVHRARLVIGADGATSAVSRAIGNRLNDGTAALSLRAYYEGVERRGAPLRVYFDRRHFPGYAWIFVDDRGLANVGIGCVSDDTFGNRIRLRDEFDRFVRAELAGMLARGSRRGPVCGGSAAFYPPASIVGDRVMLIGDAANQADPLNGGGIHKAMEGAFFASGVARHVLSVGDCSTAALGLYERRLRRHVEVDRRIGELVLSIARNPILKDLFLSGLEGAGRLAAADPRFSAFCAGVFSGVIPREQFLSLRAVYEALPTDPGAWLSLADRGGGGLGGGVALAALEGLVGAARHAVLHPLEHLHWGIDVATRAVELADRRLSTAAVAGVSSVAA